MGKDPIWRLMLRFSTPAVISMTVASSYQLIDAMFVGRLGREALAAMSVTYPLALSFTAIASGTGVGVTSLISRSLGAGDTRGADKVVGTAIALCFFLAGILALISLLNLDRILVMLGAEEGVLALARSYSQIMIYSILAAYLAMILSNIIRADGNPIFSSSVSVASALINIALDPVFIFGLGTIPPMGIAGAAIATVISQCISVAASITYIIRGKTAYHYELTDFIPSLTVIGGIYRVGVASILRSGAQFVTMGIVNRTAASFGVTPLAIIGVLVRISRFVLMPCLGMGQGMLPLIGYNFGAEKKKRISELIFKTGIISTSWTALCWLALMLFPEQVMSAFNVDTGFLDEGSGALRLFGMFFIVVGIQVLPGFFFQGIGRGLPASVLTLVRSIVFLVPLILILPRYMGVTGIWATYPITDIASLVISAGWMIKEFKKQNMSFRWWVEPSL